MRVAVQIRSVPLGLCQAYVLQSDGVVLVDGGAPGKLSAFRQAIARIPIDPAEVQLLVLTHGHWDHTGSAAEIQELTGAKIAMHEQDRHLLEHPLGSQTAGPPGVTAWGRLLNWAIGLFVRTIDIPATKVDIVLGDDGLDLAEYGIPGRVIHTPGHSPGSVSVLLETGEAFVGDTGMNQFPLRLSPGLPIFADDIEKAKESCRLLLDLGATTIYPAHGRPFPAEVLRTAAG
jgi:glyoxylase-like metal-dependent hydrolase (beta-lactamase superfamily II)